MRPHANPRDPGKALNIGYVSADFRRHPVGFFLAPVLARHDRRRFSVSCYSGRGLADDLTERLKAGADAWRSVGGLSDEALATAIRDDGIDVLVDLSGHTAGNRLTAFALRPAPVQVSWLGYFNTTGMKAIDYVLMDAETVPEGAERWFTEEVIHLPAGRFCYGPPEDAPPVAPPPVEERGRVTFASFNNLTKVGAEVVGLWARILDALPSSRLVLKWRSLGDAAVRDRYQAWFAAEGIEPNRIELQGASPHAEMLAAYGGVDVALDPFPFSGGVTSCEALWMGVPVVTWPGARPVSRQTAGFLRALGLAELIAADREDYVAIAAGLARDRDGLTALRAGLRARMAASPLCDGVRFTRHLEAAYRDMWRRWCAS